MSLLADDMIQRIIQALHEETNYDFDDGLEVQDFPDDPVARISYVAGQEKPILPTISSKPYLTPQGESIGRGQFMGRVAEQAKKFTENPELLKVPREPTAIRKPTTGDFVRQLLAREGAEYEWGGTSKKTGFDCSGLLNRVMQNMGFTNFPRHSADIYAHSKPISVKKALKTRGAILYTQGHIAVSLGNGKTIEARGEDYGVVVAEGQGRFTHGGLLPELQVAKAVQEAGRSRLRNQKSVKEPPTDPLNTQIAMSSLISAPIVFGSVMSEIRRPPTTKRGWDAHKDYPGLDFLPAPYKKMVKIAANRYGISARLIASVMFVENHGINERPWDVDKPSFDPKALSSEDARGLMQVVPGFHPEFDAGKLFNPRYNIMAGASILAANISGLGLKDGIAAYYAGAGNLPGGQEYANAVLEILRGG